MCMNMKFLFSGSLQQRSNNMFEKKIRQVNREQDIGDKI